MSAPVEVKYFDIQRELISLTPHLYQDMDIPYEIFKSDPKSRSRATFTFPCAEPEDFCFSTFYGDVWLPTLNKSSRRMTVKRKVRRRSPEDVLVEEIRDDIAECVDSVDENDREFATLKLIIGKVYFDVQEEISIDDQNQFFEGKAVADQFYINLPNMKMFLCHQTCEWTDPNTVLDFLTENGFSIASRDHLDPEVSLTLRGGFLRKRIGEGSYLFFDNTLVLNPKTLAVESWRVQDWFPMNYYIMHGFPSSNEVVIRTNIRRHVKFPDLFSLNGGRTLGLMAVDEESGGFIHRTDVGFKLLNRYENLRFITEVGEGERIRLQSNNVSCFMNLAPIKYFHFNSLSDEFTLSEDQSCEAVIEFPLTENREDLIDVIARLSLKLFSKTNDDDELPLENPPSFINQSDGTRVSSLDVQAITRLQNEDGDIYDLLGLGNSSDRKECQVRARTLKSLLLKNREQEWFKKIELDFNELMEKLTCACLVYNINL